MLTSHLMIVQESVSRDMDMILGHSLEIWRNLTFFWIVHGSLQCRSCFFNFYLILPSKESSSDPRNPDMAPMHTIHNTGTRLEHDTKMGNPAISPVKLVRDLFTRLTHR